MMKYAGITNPRGLGQIENVTGVRIALRVMVVAFLGVNLWYRFSTIFDYSRFVGGVFVALAAFSLLVIFFPKLLKAALFFFGASFFLFGFRAYDIQSQVFETVVVFVAVTVFLVNLRRKEGAGINRQLVCLILCYIGLSVLSLQLLPVGHIINDFWLFGFKTSLLQVANATPDTLFYPLGGVNRLVLFSVLTFQLAKTEGARGTYKLLFSGIFVGAVLCAFLGLLEYYGVFSLGWYRPADLSGVLHSTFLNRGWFAEYILTVVPFALIGFMNKIKGLWWKILLLGSLVVCEISLILAGARAGWVSYPLILSICWVFVYFFKEGKFESFHFRWRDLVKVAVSIPITILLSFLLIFQVLMPISEYLKNKDGVENIQKETIATSQFIKHQAGRLIESSSRIKTWTQGINVWRESPILGLGYESFCWHDRILSSIPESYTSSYKSNKKALVLDTPHNIFVQLLVSGGVVGLFLWLLIVGYALMILILDLVRNKRLLNIPIVISIISFHIYGIFQSMQYVPMIWSLVFLNLGYAMTLDEKVLSERIRRLASFVVKIMILLVLVGGVVYFTGRESQSLADKYGLRVYAQDQEWHNYLGFYSKEKGATGNFRWSGKKGLIRIHGGGLVEIRFDCHTPGVEKEPVMVDISVDDQPVDRLVFEGLGSQTWQYWLKKKGKGPHEVLFDVSRTWNPKKMGISVDNRDLGVAVSEPRFLEKMPKEDVGFYPWETTAEDIGGWPKGKEKRFRWTGKRASVKVSDQGAGVSGQKGKDEKRDVWVVFLRCSHPDIDKEPVGVRILGDGEVLRYVEFTDHKWKRVDFGADELEGKRIVTYEVSRTWNPKRMGVSGDGRDLGVGVAVP